MVRTIVILRRRAIKAQSKLNVGVKPTDSERSALERLNRQGITGQKSFQRDVIASTKTLMETREGGQRFVGRATGKVPLEVQRIGNRDVVIISRKTRSGVQVTPFGRFARSEAEKGRPVQIVSTSGTNLSPTQLSRARSLTESAQVKEFGEVIVPQQQPEVRGVELQRGAITTLDPGVEEKLSRTQFTESEARRIAPAQFSGMIPSVSASSQPLEGQPFTGDQRFTISAASPELIEGTKRSRSPFRESINRFFGGISLTKGTGREEFIQPPSRAFQGVGLLSEAAGNIFTLTGLRTGGVATRTIASRSGAIVRGGLSAFGISGKSGLGKVALTGGTAALTIGTTGFIGSSIANAATSQQRARLSNLGISQQDIRSSFSESRRVERAARLAPRPDEQAIFGTSLGGLGRAAVGELSPVTSTDREAFRSSITAEGQRLGLSGTDLRTFERLQERRRRIKGVTQTVGLLQAEGFGNIFGGISTRVASRIPAFSSGIAQRSARGGAVAATRGSAGFAEGVGSFVALNIGSDTQDKLLPRVSRGERIITTPGGAQFIRPTTTFQPGLLVKSVGFGIIGRLSARSFGFAEGFFGGRIGTKAVPTTGNILDLPELPGDITTPLLLPSQGGVRGRARTFGTSFNGVSTPSNILIPQSATPLLSRSTQIQPITTRLPQRSRTRTFALSSALAASLAPSQVRSQTVTTQFPTTRTSIDVFSGVPTQVTSFVNVPSNVNVPAFTLVPKFFAPLPFSFGSAGGGIKGRRRKGRPRQGSFVPSLLGREQFFGSGRTVTKAPKIAGLGIRPVVAGTFKPFKIGIGI